MASLASAAAEDAPENGVERRYADPVDGLVHAAVADRPLDEVIQLIQLLEQSPEYAKATVDALRAVGTDRSVEDVTRLVALLTRPPRNADSADEAIRAAAEGRPVEDVTRLMGLLHRPPMEAHCGEAAVRAAATSRPVEELVQLIGRMAQEQGARAERRQAEAAARDMAAPAADESHPDLSQAVPSVVRRPVRERRDWAAKGATPPAWPRWIAALALIACGLAHFPSHRGGASVNAYGLAVGVSGLCVLLGLALFRKGTLPVLAVGVVVPAGLAAAQLLEGRVHSPGLSLVLDLTAAPPWGAGLAAVIATLAALTALLGLLSAGRAGRRPEVRSLIGSNRAAD
ncbi:hypothetical protein [Streptomyces sp. NPDC050704]|uniref:hypothetical protein n=1 Tax=Streptomyces sp. NPDC050704 TaxID=3157219 RepID=UPI0034331E9D